LDEAVLFLQRSGRVIREISFSAEAETYIAPDMTILAEHITGTGGIVDWAYQSDPTSLLWCVRADGDMAVMTYVKEQQVYAWARFTTDGSYESVAVISSAGEDQVWAVVNRTINGTTKRYVEYFMPRDWGTDPDDAFFVDCGLSWDGGADKAITNATHASPIVLSSAAHLLSNDDLVKIQSVCGMKEINSTVFMVKNKAANTIDLYDETGTNPIDATVFTLTIDAAPTPADFAPGATLTGGTSGATCVVVAKESSTVYQCNTLSGTFSDDEVITDDAGSPNSRDCATGYPVVVQGYGTYVGSITGDVTDESTTIDSVSAADIAALVAGCGISGTGIPTGTTVTAIAADSITISAEATATNTGVTLTVSGTISKVLKSVTGLSHLEDEVVVAVTDGAAHPPETVASGGITLDWYANQIHVGLLQTATLMPSRVEVEIEGGSSQGTIKHITELVVRLADTIGLSFGQDADNLTPISFREADEAMDSQPALFTGDKIVKFPGDYAREGDFVLVHNQPLPMTILSVVAKATLYD
jgi:hypothetical protein